MKSLLSLILILSPGFAFASETVELAAPSTGQVAGQFIVAVGANVNAELASNGQTYQAVVPIAARLGYRFTYADVLAEYSYVRSSTGTEWLSIAETNQEALLWIRKGDPTARTFVPYVALGGGGHWQTATTRLGAQTDVERGSLEATLAAAVGLEIRAGRLVSLTTEARLTDAESETPNPLWGLSSYLNFTF